MVAKKKAKSKKARPKRVSKDSKTHSFPKKSKRTLEERLMEWDEEEDENAPALHISEEMRAKLLKEEFKLRKKQPTAWTKTKYRKFAFFNTGKKKEEKEKIVIQEEHEIESDQKKKDKLKKHDRPKK